MRSNRMPVGVRGEVAEWFKAHAWKACVGETLPRVRIPLSPPRGFDFIQKIWVGKSPPILKPHKGRDAAAATLAHATALLLEARGFIVCKADLQKTSLTAFNRAGSIIEQIPANV